MSEKTSHRNRNNYRVDIQWMLFSRSVEYISQCTILKSKEFIWNVIFLPKTCQVECTYIFAWQKDIQPVRWIVKQHMPLPDTYSYAQMSHKVHHKACAVTSS